MLRTPLAHFTHIATLLTLVFAAAAPPAFAQGVLVDARPPVRLPRPIWPPRPEPAPASYKIESIEVNAKLKDSIARVQVSQTFVNTGSGQLEATFTFPLPYDGAIDELTLLVDGKEFAAKLLPKDEARRRYEAIVRANKDPALLEWIGTGMYQTSVFPIPPGAKRTVTLRYTQLCRTSHGLTDFLFPLSTAKYTDKPIEKVALNLVIVGSADLKNIYSPTHELKIERSGDRQATVSVALKNVIPTEDFRLFFDAADQGVLANVVSYRPDKSKDGYFLLLASPKLEQAGDNAAPKTVVFVIDRSGSMSGEKIQQAKEAAKFVLNNLRDGDTFNIVAYDSQIESFRPELEKFTPETRAAALGFVNGLFAGGSTNIDGALDRALGMLRDDERPSYVIFLTDGLPTVGELKEPAIVARAAKANQVRARLFSFGVGYDVNSRLLDKLARENHGQSEYVRPDEDIEASVSQLYRRIGAPVMVDATLAIDVEGLQTADGPAVTRVYPHGKFDLFAGDQAVIVGRYRTSGHAKATIAGKVGGQQQSFDFPADLVEHSDDDTNSFVAKLWATRRVGEIIDELDLKGKNDELIKELVELATQHGILTPYTSFLADETSESNSAGATQLSAVQQAGRALGRLEDAAGEGGFKQREAKSAYRLADRPAAAPLSAGSVGGPADEAQLMENLAATAGRGATYYDDAADKHVVAKNVITVGRKTFFRHGDQWIDSSVTDEEAKHAKRIERFSDDYFAMADRHGQYVAQYLAIEDPVVVKVDGEVYAW
jgi:Ca-activated chloride channel family protein